MNKDFWKGMLTAALCALCFGSGLYLRAGSMEEIAREAIQSGVLVWKGVAYNVDKMGGRE